MSSLTASQSTLCLQTRQEAVANDPEKKKIISDFQHDKLYKYKQDLFISSDLP